METRLTILLDTEERKALYLAAQIDLRPLRDEARWLIRQGLAQRGLLLLNDSGPTDRLKEPAE
jgi:hypothetical protein